MDTRIFTLILPILGILAVCMTDIRTRHPKKYGNGRTDPVAFKKHRWTRTAFRNSVATSSYNKHWRIFTLCQHDTPQKNALSPPPRPGDVPFGALPSLACGNSVGAVHFRPQCIENHTVITNLRGFLHFSNIIRHRKMH